jgi:hypothetical protein
MPLKSCAYCIASILRFRSLAKFNQLVQEGTGQIRVPIVYNPVHKKNSWIGFDYVLPYITDLR